MFQISTTDMAVASFVKHGRFMKIRDYFDRIRIISLPTRLDRRRDVAAELKRHGASMEPGKVEFFDGIRPATDAGFPSLGMHGCYMSHLGVLREARDAGLSRVLVLEDDFQFSRKFAKAQDAILDQLKGQDWGIVYFGHVIPTEPTLEPTLIEADPNMGILLLHCYGVNGPVLDRLIAFLELLLTRPPGDPDGGPMSLDGAFSIFRERNPDIRTLILAPSLCWQRSSRTDNHKLKWIDVVPVVRQLVGAARRFKIVLASFR